MVWTILKWIFIAIVLSLIALWLWQGGYWKVARYAEIIPNPLSTSTDEYITVLPGTQTFPEVPDTTSSAEEMEFGYYGLSGEDGVVRPEDSSQSPIPNTARGEIYPDGATDALPRVSSSPSPYAGMIFLEAGNAQSESSRTEYLRLRTVATLTTPTAISGWSLQSAATGKRVVIPLAAAPFVQGVINTVHPVTLLGGETVIVATGISPVGVSFRESMCTGYLAQTQNFTPSLANACPRVSDQFLQNPDNIRRYGSNCMDYVARLPQCTFPTTAPSNLSAACQVLLRDTLSYNGCVRANKSYSAYSLNTWRLYLSESSDLWHNMHDTIRLLDATGKTVDTIRY